MSNPEGQIVSLIWYHLCDCSYLSTEGVAMLNRFRATRWPQRHVQWELCGASFGENVANLLVFFFIMGIMTVLRGCCSSSPSRVGRIITSKPSLCSGAGRTTPLQPGHYPLNIFHNNYVCWICYCYTKRCNTIDTHQHHHLGDHMAEHKTTNIIVPPLNDRNY